jgi:hypothetical protein
VVVKKEDSTIETLARKGIIIVYTRPKLMEGDINLILPLKESPISNNS